MPYLVPNSIGSSVVDSEEDLQVKAKDFLSKRIDNMLTLDDAGKLCIPQRLFQKMSGPKGDTGARGEPGKDGRNFDDFNTDAPHDGKPYVRVNGEWIKLEIYFDRLLEGYIVRQRFARAKATVNTEPESFEDLIKSFI